MIQFETHYFITLFRQAKIFRNLIFTPTYFATIKFRAQHQNTVLLLGKKFAAKVADVRLNFTDHFIKRKEFFLSFVKTLLTLWKLYCVLLKGSQVRVEDKFRSTNIEDFFYGYQLHYIAFCCTTAIAQVLWASWYALETLMNTKNANGHK